MKRQSFRAEVSKVQHYWLQIDAMTQHMQVREERARYGADSAWESEQATE